MNETVDLLGVRVHALSKLELVDRATTWASGGVPRTICYVNAHCLNLAATRPDYRAVLNEADLVYPDGIGAVWAGSLTHRRRLVKITGRDWIDDLARAADRQGLRLFILAGRPGVAQRARRALSKSRPSLQIVGACDGFFSEHSERELFQTLERTRPHILLVGMSTPRQELWIARNRPSLAVPVCWAVGALFDYVVGLEPPVPPWMNRLALEWFWRLLMDPRGKWRRYLLGNPLFVLRVLTHPFLNS